MRSLIYLILQFVNGTNCYTFATKLLGLFDPNRDSERFINLIKNEFKPFNCWVTPSEFPNNTLIIWEYPNKEHIVYTHTELIKGIPITSKLTYYKYHFGIFHNNLVYDLNFGDEQTSYIRVRRVDSIDINKDDHRLYYVTPESLSKLF